MRKVTISAAMPMEDVARVDEMAKSHGISRSECIAQIVEFAMKLQASVDNYITAGEVVLPRVAYKPHEDHVFDEEM